MRPDQVHEFSEHGRNFLVGLEEVKNKSYLDSGGAPSIGIGHLLTKSERSSGKIHIMGQFSIEYEDGLTDDQVMALFDQDLGDLDAEVDRRLSSPASLNQNQFDALCCFTFNVGLDAFTKSTLLRVINEGMLDQVPTQMRRWIFDNGVKVAGLQNRRDKEILIWEGLV